MLDFDKTLIKLLLLLLRLVTIVFCHIEFSLKKTADLTVPLHAFCPHYLRQGEDLAPFSQEIHKTL